MRAASSKLFICIFFLVATTSLFAQEANNLIGKWQLHQITYKNTKLDAAANRESVLAIFNQALNKQLTAEQRLTLEDLDQAQADAETLLYKYFQTTLEFRANGGFYNSSRIPDKSLSGEFIVNKKRLLLEWETAAKNELKVLKSTSEALVLKDTDLNITYHYLKV